MLKKKAIWIGTLSLAAVGLLLPQWADASSSEEGTPTVTLEKQYDETHTDGHGFRHPFKKHVMKEEFQVLLDEGYSKKEIMNASMISNASDTKIEEVLKNFKEFGSWSKTAEHYGVNLEKHMITRRT